MVTVPSGISKEAQKTLSRTTPDAKVPQNLEQLRSVIEKLQAAAGDAYRKLYPVNLGTDTIAGVHVRVITPLTTETDKRDRVLINLHGGAFSLDAGSLTESIPIANLTGTRVISVLYRLAPEHPFPAGLDDAIAVYRELLKTYQPANIAIYGTSAGAILSR